MSTAVLLAGTGVLAAGTLALRVAGARLGAGMQRAGRAEQLAQAGTTVLFCALIATSTCYDGHDFAGASRLVAVGAAGLLAWRRAPFIVVVVAAVLTAALLRLSGIP